MITPKYTITSISNKQGNLVVGDFVDENNISVLTFQTIVGGTFVPATTDINGNIQYSDTEATVIYEFLPSLKSLYEQLADYTPAIRPVPIIEETPIEG